MLRVPMDASLSLVRDRFREVQVRMTELYGLDGEFRDLCDEYAVCAQTVSRLESRGPSSAAMRREYVALLLRVERELLRYLEECPDG